MNRMMPMMDARKRLTVLPEELVTSQGVDVVEVTRRGKPVLAVLPGGRGTLLAIWQLRQIGKIAGNVPPAIPIKPQTTS